MEQKTEEQEIKEDIVNILHKVQSSIAKVPKHSWVNAYIERVVRENDAISLEDLPLHILEDMVSYLDTSLCSNAENTKAKNIDYKEAFPKVYDKLKYGIQPSQEWDFVGDQQTSPIPADGSVNNGVNGSGAIMSVRYDSVSKEDLRTKAKLEAHKEVMEELASKVNEKEKETMANVKNEAKDKELDFPTMPTEAASKKTLDNVEKSHGADGKGGFARRRLLERMNVQHKFSGGEQIDELVDNESIVGSEFKNPKKENPKEPTAIKAESDKNESELAAYRALGGSIQDLALNMNRLQRYESLGTEDEIEELVDAHQELSENYDELEENAKNVLEENTSLLEQVDALRENQEQLEELCGDDLDLDQLADVITKATELSDTITNVQDDLEKLNEYEEFGSPEEVEELVEAVECYINEIQDLRVKLESTQSKLAKYEELGTVEELTDCIGEVEKSLVDTKTAQLSAQLGLDKSFVEEIVRLSPDIAEAERILKLTPSTNAPELEVEGGELVSNSFDDDVGIDDDFLEDTDDASEGFEEDESLEQLDDDVDDLDDFSEPFKPESAPKRREKAKIVRKSESTRREFSFKRKGESEDPTISKVYKMLVGGRF